MKFWRKWRRRRPAVDPKTGLINLRAESAPRLVQHFQQMQDAASGATRAVRQHEIATSGQLVENAESLGLTPAEAEKLSREYLAISDKTLTAKVDAIGLYAIHAELAAIKAKLLGLWLKRNQGDAPGEAT